MQNDIDMIILFMMNKVYFMPKFAQFSFPADQYFCFFLNFQLILFQLRCYFTLSSLSK